MSPVTRSQLRHYSVAALSVVLALLLTQLLMPLIAPTISPLFFAAVTLSAWYGGLGPGLLATVLSVFASDYFLIPPLYSFGQASGADFVQLFAFSAVAGLTSSLNAAQRGAKQRVEESLLRLQTSEEKYRHLMDTAYEGIWLLDAQLRTEYVNERLAQMFGYTRQEMCDRSLYDFMDRQARTEAQRRVERRKQGITEQFDFRYRHRDGSDLWAIVSTRPRLNQQGQFIGVLAMLTDITERKQGEKEREQLLVREQEARQLAEAASRMKDEFLAVVSHELRSPLNAILGWCQLLRTRSFDEATTQKALETIERNAEAQNQLIEDLLDVSRIIRGKVRLYARPLNLGQVIETAVDTVAPTAQNKSIQIQTQLDDVGLIDGDPDRLQQVLWNLLSNAIKFTPEGGRIEVHLSRDDSHAKIQVSDTGIGIDSEFLPYVFERFRQQSSTTTRAYGGLGLGLAITQNLVELHGGTIIVNSSGKDRGSTFTVTLPLASDSETREQVPLSQPSSADQMALTKLRVLVVDDELDSREFLIAALEQYGAQVTAAASASEALRILEQFNPDVLVSDIGMPIEDGYALIHKIRNLPSERGKILAVALTAYTTEADQRKVLQVGFQRHVPKPTNARQLAAVVADLAKTKVNP